MSKRRVILADDPTLPREALEALLVPECDVVARVSDGRALVAAVRVHRPDLVVLDVSMRLLNGLEAARQIKKFDPTISLVFATANEDPDLAAEAFRAGASAYVMKRSSAAELAMSAGEETNHHRRVQLTRRQREVLQLLAEGKSMKQAGEVLDVTARTVAFHKYRMMEQLEIKTNAELIQYAIRHHFV